MAKKMLLKKSRSKVPGLYYCDFESHVSSHPCDKFCLFRAGDRSKSSALSIRSVLSGADGTVQQVVVSVGSSSVLLSVEDFMRAARVVVKSFRGEES